MREQKEGATEGAQRVLSGHRACLRMSETRKVLMLYL